MAESAKKVPVKSEKSSVPAPSEGWAPRNRSRPEVASIANTAMLSWPRLEPYTKRPFGCTRTSAVLLSPVNFESLYQAQRQQATGDVPVQ